MPLTTQAPAPAILAYITRGVNMLASCEAGQVLERQLIGWCYNDIRQTVPSYDIEDVGKTVARMTSNEVGRC